MKRAYADLRRGQMHYRYAGGGEPVVMLHMSGSSSDEYERTGQILAEKYAVYALDFFCFGGSDRTEKYLSFAQHMETVLEFMDVMGIEKASLVGNLVGANIAVHLAADHPERVNKLAMLHLCYNPDPDFYRNMRYGPVFEQIQLADDGSHLMEMWARAAKYGEAKEVSDARAVCLHKAGDLGEALHWALCEDEDFESFVRRVQVPAKLFAYGKMENKTTELAAALMKNCRYELLADATPYFARATPQVCAQKLLAFLDE